MRADCHWAANLAEDATGQTTVNYLELKDILKIYRCFIFCTLSGLGWLVL